MPNPTIDPSALIEAQAQELARVLHRALVAETALAASRVELERTRAALAEAQAGGQEGQQ